MFRRVGDNLEIAAGRQRDRISGRDSLRLPKGIVEPGETPEQAALREVGEEAGLEAEVLASLTTVSYDYDEGATVVSKRVHFFLMKHIDNMTEGDKAQLAYFENRGDIEFIDLWDNDRIRDPDAWLGLDPLQWADALDLVWIDESVTSGRIEEGELQDTTTPIINNENFACDILGTLDPPRWR